MAVKYAMLYEGQDIELAQYGTSNTGRFKTLYREGLKKSLRRADANHFRRTILSFCQWHSGKRSAVISRALMPKRKFLRAISALSAITRFGWVIPYLFGASPVICSSFLQGKPTLPFEKTGGGMYYLPYADLLFVWS